MEGEYVSDSFKPQQRNMINGKAQRDFCKA